MNQDVKFDRELIQRYDKAGPRYTSYPTALQFHSGFDTAHYRKLAAYSNRAEPPSPLSLYFHIPFCNTVCYYCACNKIITKNRNHAAPYLERVHKEIALQAQLFSHDRPVQQLHWGGGTPTFINHAQMRALMQVTRKHFHLLDDDSGEYSIEIDPRSVDAAGLALLRELGFNRVSLGVQDFDLKVQRAVNRIQSEEETYDVLHQARNLGFHSVNLDLIYGLPHQSVESFARTLEKVIYALPDRLSVFNYAHLPEMFKTQRQINQQELPSAQVKLAILQYTIERLQQAGYIYIGMDHFARPDDELALAQRQGTLYRNFQGYSTHADCDLVAMGMTSIGKVGHSYSQNHKTMEQYVAAIDAGDLAVFRGIELSADDILRREVISQLICHFHLDISKIEQAHGIDFAAYFAAELEVLRNMQTDGLLYLKQDSIQISPAGKLLIRNICMVFDAYLQASSSQRYSKVI